MSVNLIAINVGNTRTQFASVIDEQVGDLHYVAHDRTDDLADALGNLYAKVAEAEGGEPVAFLSAVNEEAAKPVIDALTVLQCPTAKVDEHVGIPIGRKLDPETIVGTDRLLNAAAAYDQTKQACVVVDAGSAVTVDFVDGEGTFHGGAILPGAQMQLEAMHEHTALLPELKFRKPAEAIGHNTTEAMLDGVFHGIRGAVRELTEKYAELYGAYPNVIATGGDAHTLFDGYELVEAIVDGLTLRGMAVTRRYQLEQAEG